jgi:hypothetical protein
MADFMGGGGLLPPFWTTGFKFALIKLKIWHPKWLSKILDFYM